MPPCGYSGEVFSGCILPKSRKLFQRYVSYSLTKYPSEDTTFFDRVVWLQY